ncbi:MAG: hypothetical protein ACXW4C_10790 [Nitrospira sp.]
MEWTDKLGAVAAAGAKLQVREAWLNGEVVVLLPIRVPTAVGESVSTVLAFLLR